jgi:hypothetical protein
MDRARENQFVSGGIVRKNSVGYRTLYAIVLLLTAVTFARFIIVITESFFPESCVPSKF